MGTFFDQRLYKRLGNYWLKSGKSKFGIRIMKPIFMLMLVVSLNYCLTPIKTMRGENNNDYQTKHPKQII
jgi:hypothetical protein